MVSQTAYYTGSAGVARFSSHRIDTSGIGAQAGRLACLYSFRSAGMEANELNIPSDC